MKFCTNCGGQIPEGTSFCPTCGAAVAQDANQQAQAQTQQPGQQYAGPQPNVGGANDVTTDKGAAILSYLGFIPETEVVDINHITQYVLTRLNQATEKGNAEMINNYQNILGIINQKNNGLNGAENNPHHL